MMEEVDPRVAIARELGETDPPWIRPRAAYVHIPFCAHKCGYCDFASVAGAESRIDDYLNALALEIEAVLGEPRLMTTVFVGGGTPTYVSAEQLERFLATVNRWLPVEPGGEFTVESNPNTLTEDKVAALVGGGVNRVSLGAQSFQTAHLATLERNHEPASVGRALELLRPRIENVSIDLIFGVPGQTLAEWESDVAMATSLATPHCSAYGLTFEKGTRLWKQKELGIVTQTDEELERAMFETAAERFSAAGLLRYEISNFAAKPERRCRHNQVYWANHAYFGFGTGAAAYAGGLRTLNTRDLDSYIRRARESHSPVTQAERLEADARARETAMLNLRRAEGLDRAEFQKQTGVAFEDLAPKKLAAFVSQGLLEDAGGRVRFTPDGLLLADGVLAAFL
ncbi:MAG TPA: radical SAM family heme chaperone HemW [Planctomycetia bacterium]|nr:radical SAM family heme chaperone HemW [Planctomycetia bacterium]